MLFWFLNVSQCVGCMLGIKKSTKFTPKKDILFKTNLFSRMTMNGLFGLQHCFPGFVMSQSGPNPAYGNSWTWTKQL